MYEIYKQARHFKIFSRDHNDSPFLCEKYLVWWVCILLVALSCRCCFLSPFCTISWYNASKVLKHWHCTYCIVILYICFDNKKKFRFMHLSVSTRSGLRMKYTGEVFWDDILRFQELITKNVLKQITCELCANFIRHAVYELRLGWNEDDIGYFPKSENG